MGESPRGVLDSWTPSNKVPWEACLDWGGRFWDGGGRGQRGREGPGGVGVRAEPRAAEEREGVGSWGKKVLLVGVGEREAGVWGVGGEGWLSQGLGHVK